jgi:hypothetical protein
MTASTPDEIIAGFPHSSLPKVTGEPTFESHEQVMTIRARKDMVMHVTSMHVLVRYVRVMHVMVWCLRVRCVREMHVWT